MSPRSACCCWFSGGLCRFKTVVAEPVAAGGLLFKEFIGRPQLRFNSLQLIHGVTESRRSLQSLGVPADVLACDLEPGAFAVKSVEIGQMLAQEAMDFDHAWWR